MIKGKVIISPREKRGRKYTPSAPPTLFGFCWQCRFSGEFKEYLWCKKHQKQVKKKEQCEDFFGYYKKIYTKQTTGKQRHKKS